MPSSISENFEEIPKPNELRTLFFFPYKLGFDSAGFNKAGRLCVRVSGIPVELKSKFSPCYRTSGVLSYLGISIYLELVCREGFVSWLQEGGRVLCTDI